MRTCLSLQIWKCREIFTKCRVAPSAAQLKTIEFQQVGWGSPYSGSREPSTV